MKPKYSAVLFLLSLGITSSVFASTPYDDVPLDHWAYDAIQDDSKENTLFGEVYCYF